MNNRKLRKFECALLAGCMAVGMLGCGKSSNTDKDTQKDNISVPLVDLESETEDSIRKATTDFSIELFKQAYNNGDDNILVSPFSVQSALGMTANGAGSNTLSQMENVLAGSNSIDYLNAYMAKFAKSDDDLLTANSIWIKNSDNSFDTSEDFLNINKYVYDAETIMAPFDASTINDINNWVNDKTQGMIPELVDQINPNDVMILVNAAVFEGTWAEAYDENKITENYPFECYDGSESSVTLLSGKESTYIHDNNATGFVKDYDGGKYSFVALLPNEDVTIDEYVATLDGEAFASIYDQREHCTVYASIPEFSYSDDIILNDSLIDMGMGEAFSDTADFSKMSASGSCGLYISKVCHKTYISFDRNGTRAAAATEVSMTKNAIEIDEDAKSVLINRPFVYAIVDTTTGQPIFIGAVKNL